MTSAPLTTPDSTAVMSASGIIFVLEPVNTNPAVWRITRLGNRLVRVSVFGSKSCVFLAVCGQIWPKILGTFDLRSS